MCKLLKKYAFAPERLVTDDLRSCSATGESLGSNAGMSAGGGRTIELRIRIRRRGGGHARCSGSRARGSAQKFLSTSAVSNTLNAQRHLVSAPTDRVLRADALAMWRTAVAAA